MNIKLLYFAFVPVLMLTSCGNNKNSSVRYGNELEQLKRENDSLRNIQSPAIHTSLNKDTSINSKTHLETDKTKPPIRIRKDYKSMLDVLRSIYSDGSTNQEVKMVIGSPQYIERPNLNSEIWYYENFELTFREGIVRDISGDVTEKYVPLHELLGSENNFERKFSDKLMDRILKADNVN